MGIEEKFPTKVRVAEVLDELARGHGEKDGAAAQRIGLTAQQYSTYRKGGLATMRVVLLIAKAYNVGVDYVLRERPDLVLESNGDIGWRLSHELSRIDQILQRFVAVSVLRGYPREGIARELAKRRQPLDRESSEDEIALAYEEVGDLARGAITLGYVDLVATDPAKGFEVPGLSEALGKALTAASPGAREVHASVVRNVAGPGFNRDPIAPFLVARVAHEVLRRFLERYPYTANIGLAGGMHVQALVQTIGPRCSPFPDPTRGHRQFTFMPLTMEPFYDHLYGISDGLVAEFARRGAAMLGPRRIEAMSFKPFGLTGNAGEIRLDPMSVGFVRERYNRLDVAVFGCGTGPGDGWIDKMVHRLRLDAKEKVRTDVCLNLLDENGQLIPLEIEGRRREPLGVDLARIQTLARTKDRLALLLASGQAKGESMAVLAKAGAISAAVCDAAAAEACLNALK